MKKNKKEVSSAIAEMDDGYDCVTFKAYGTRFYFFVTEKGKIKYRYGTKNERLSIKELVDESKTVVFKDTIELFHDGENLRIDEVKLSDIDYATLKGKQNRILAEIKAKKDQVKDWTLGELSKAELVKKIDKWEKKTKTIVVKRGKREKQKVKVAIHTFFIGREKYVMSERVYDDELVISPEYKVINNLPKVGGVACEIGLIPLWKYYYESDNVSDEEPTKKKGQWEVARNMSYNEQICYYLIKNHGVFSR